MDMNIFGGFIPLLITLIVAGVPIAVILKKAGYSQWLVILAFIPLVNLVALWVFAFANWPALQRG